MKENSSIVIIGAGIIGVCVAYNLAKKGIKDVTVVDKFRAGSGSTSASLGGFRHQFSNELSTKLSMESIKIIDDFEEITGYDPLVKHDGYLFIAESEKSLAHLKKNREIQTSLDVPVELLSREELAMRFPFYVFDDVLGGTLCMKDGHASTFAVHQGFMTRAKELGVEFLENTEVLKIGTNSSKITNVSTSKGNIRTNKVLVAAGAYSGLVGNLAGVNVPIKPIPRKILVTKSFFDSVPAEIPLIVDVDSTLVIAREGQGIIMSDNLPTESSFELKFPEDYDERIFAKSLKKVPSLASASISYAVTGLYEMTPDANPIVSSIPEIEGLYCCAGFAGHGFMHAPVMGELVSEMMSGTKPHLDVSSFQIDRFKGEMPKEGLII